MKTSEALLLGSTLLKPVCGVFMNEENDSGCALGMVAVAMHGIAAVCEFRYQQSQLLPAWLMSSPRRVPLPCDCQAGLLMGGGGGRCTRSVVESSHSSVIVHLFNQHVCDGTWTIEQLADWIRSVEPNEPASASAEPAGENQPALSMSAVR